MASPAASASRPPMRRADPGPRPPAPSAVPITELSPGGLVELSRRHGWSLNAAELEAIRGHFRSLRREPTRAELETLAQTWSEHCKHKTFTGPIRYTDGKKTLRFRHLLRETIMEPSLGLKKPWCLSLFKDNAGIVKFDGRWALAFKVETHNHPCALEPYGGAATGAGGVIRDVLAAGLGAKPVLNTDVFCVAPPDRAGELPEGALHPRRVLHGVVAGVRDYGNRMGIPTAAGALWFDEAYRLNPLVFCGTVGLLPTWAVRKEVRPGDLIVAAGGRTGRDGLHGATFSSAALDGGSRASCVQIGHAIMEKRLLDALLAARDARLYRSVTDCGAGGFSSAIGELGGRCGARVRLERALLKASDLEPWEIWLSESQERMVLSVPPRSLKALEKIFAAEGVETSVLGEFSRTGALEVSFDGEPIVDLRMSFLHDGLPRIERAAVWTQKKPANGRRAQAAPASKARIQRALHALLGHWNVCSRAWVVRQYDHEVQGGTVIKPLQGAFHDGPGDGCVIWPHAATGETANWRGFAVAHGINPSYGKLDPYLMALACADEALRNLACTGADVSEAAFLDNFCWGNPEDPTVLGSLVRAALGCRDAALGFKVPFISGKDSLYNEYKGQPVPATLLISAVAPLRDVRKAVTMDFKAPNNPLYLLGRTAEELGGSLYAEWAQAPGGQAPTASPAASRETLLRLGRAIREGLVASCHDLSEGGLGVAAAEMAFSGDLGARLDLDLVLRDRGLQEEEMILFSESQGRLLVEVPEEKERAFLKVVRGVPVSRLGATIANPVLRLIGLDGAPLLEEPLSALKESWLRPLPKGMDGTPKGGPAAKGGA